MKMQKYWYSGFIGVIGLYTLPWSIAAIKDLAPLYDATNLARFLYFLPSKTLGENG